MCLIAIGYGVSREYALVLAANRDERHARASLAADWWPDDPEILGGRDLVAGGTWLAVDTRGRVAAVTNRFDGESARAPRSRGELVTSFLHGRASAQTFSEELAPFADQYGPFNLLTFDGSSLRYTSNLEPPCTLSPGFAAFSNAQSTANWPKVRRAREGLAALLERSEPVERAFSLLAEQSSSDANLEHRRSSLFVQGPDFGTRCSTVLLIRHDGTVRFAERRFGASGAPDGETRIDFALEPPRCVRS
jgi:uncharacterized protein with NRDE domain